MLSLEQTKEQGSWCDDDNDALIDHILSRYHQVQRKQIIKLVDLSERVDELHRAHPKHPKGLTATLFKMSDVLLAHMEKEEHILFPILRQGLYQVASSPISALEHEHASHGAEIENIYTQTNNLTLPPDASENWQKLYADLKTFIDDLRAHIELENGILFRRNKS